MSTPSIPQPTPPVTTLDLSKPRDQLRILAAHGATFRFDSAWNSYGPKAGKRPIEEGWQDKPHSLEEAITHLDGGSNISILAGAYSKGIIGIDLDQDAKAFAEAYPGLRPWVAWRANAPGRAKFIVRCNESPPSRKCPEKGFEILSTGCGCTVVGRHQSGAALNLYVRGPLPEVTVDELAAVWRHWTGTEYIAPPPNPYGQDDIPPSLFAAQTLLQRVTADDYEKWYRVGLALKHDYGEAAFIVWDTWSRKCPEKYSEKECRRVWASFKPRSDKPVTMRTIEFWARG
jgi:hypothetical protein